MSEDLCIKAEQAFERDGNGGAVVDSIEKHDLLRSFAVTKSEVALRRWEIDLHNSGRRSGPCGEIMFSNENKLDSDVASRHGHMRAKEVRQ